jgi:hypothetical protein
VSRRFLVPVALLLAVPIVLFVLRAPERASTVSLLPAPSEVVPGHEPRDLVMPPAVAEPVARDGRTSSEPRASVGSARERAAAGPPVAPPVAIHGRVVDARTGVPVRTPLALGLAVWGAGKRSPLNARVEPDGTFELTTREPDWLAARVVEWSTATELETDRHRYADEREPDGSWRLPLDVGWMAALEIVAPEDADLHVRSAALVEVVDGDERTWSQPIVPRNELRFLLHRAARFEPDPAHTRWLVVEATIDSGPEQARWHARTQVPVQNGLQPERIRVELEPETFAQGRVLDEHGEAWAQAVVELQPQFELPHAREADELFAETEADGRFEFRELVPGEYGLRVSAPFTPGLLELRSIARGANDLGSMRLDRSVGRGSIRGELVAVDGAGDEGPVALLTLRHRETRAELVGMVFEFNLLSGPTGRTGFAFDHVPVGPYELEVLALDGRRYPASPLAVEAPAEGLILEAHPSELAPCELRLIDARSGEAIERHGVLRFLAGRWLPTKPELLTETDGPCIVLAEGHRPRRVERLGPFLRSEGGLRRFELELEPGWGRAVLFRDLSAAPPASADDFAAFFGPALAGVRVRAAGQELARSDAAGLALLALERQPEGLAFELPGYRVVSSDADDGMQLVLLARE